MKDRTLAVLKALSDRTRLDIYRRVAAGKGPVCVCRLVDRFPVSQPTISHHLRILREAGLVTVEKRGTWSWFEAVPGGPDVLLRLVKAGRKGRRKREPDSCC